MLKQTQVQRLMFLFAVAGLFAITADFACLEDVCADLRTGEFRTIEAVNDNRVLNLDEALRGAAIQLTGDQKQTLGRTGQLFGIVKPGRPVKHPNGTVEMPDGWLPPIPEGHPWAAKLTPADDAFYSFVEERIFKAKLYDPTNPEHVTAVEAYLKKRNSAEPEFLGWTYGSRPECAKRMIDAFGTKMPDRSIDTELL
jgi:hypothetical protein